MLVHDQLFNTVKQVVWWELQQTPHEVGMPHESSQPEKDSMFCKVKLTEASGFYRRGWRLQTA
jgi:hypothetical protein